jgi:hypothetical protein
MVKHLLDTNKVIVARYSYNSIANPRLVCLIPKLTKSKMPVSSLSFIEINFLDVDSLRSSARRGHAQLCVPEVGMSS